MQDKFGPHVFFPRRVLIDEIDKDIPQKVVNFLTPESQKENKFYKRKIEMTYFSYIKFIWSIIPDPLSFGAEGPKHKHVPILVLFLILKSLAFLPPE